MAGFFNSVVGNMFGGPNNPPQQGQQATPGNIPVENTNPPHPTNPMAPAGTVAATEGVKSPLDQFKDMWKNDPTKKPKPEEPIFNVDPSKVQEAAKQNDFLKAIPAELLEKIKAGGEESVPAMMAAMNMMSQKGFGDSATATASLITSALEKQQAKFEKIIEKVVGKQNLNAALSKSNPIFDHPAAAPMLEFMKNQVREKFPDMTVDEQAAKASEYLVSFAEAANPKKPVTTDSNTTDWSTFLDD